MKDSLRLTPEDVSRASPALLPAPKSGTLYAVVGADESEEFLRQNSVMQQAWGKKVVPVSEDLPGLNHFSVLQTLAEPSQRAHQLALKLLGLPGRKGAGPRSGFAGRKEPAPCKGEGRSPMGVCQSLHQQVLTRVIAAQ
eukprot:gene3669-4582_t